MKAALVCIVRVVVPVNCTCPPLSNPGEIVREKPERIVIVDANIVLPEKVSGYHTVFG